MAPLAVVWNRSSALGSLFVENRHIKTRQLYTSLMYFSANYMSDSQIPKCWSSKKPHFNKFGRKLTYLALSSKITIINEHPVQ